MFLEKLRPLTLIPYNKNVARHPAGAQQPPQRTHVGNYHQVVWFGYLLPQDHTVATHCERWDGCLQLITICGIESTQPYNWSHVIIPWRQLSAAFRTTSLPVTYSFHIIYSCVVFNAVKETVTNTCATGVEASYLRVNYPSDSYPRATTIGTVTPPPQTVTHRTILPSVFHICWSEQITV